MTRYLLRRLPSAAVVLVLASMAIFGIIRLVPGDPAATLAGPDATPESLAQIRADLGLDQPVWTQYVDWVQSVLTLDLGRSYRVGGEVSDLLADAAVNTLALTGFALLLAIVMALTLSLVTVIVNKPWLDALRGRPQHPRGGRADLRDRAGAGAAARGAGAGCCRPGGTPPDGFLARPGHLGAVPPPARRSASPCRRRPR